ncbi:hypothetical protein V8F33_001750 [Rhypophila sp. PSN 637]
MPPEPKSKKKDKRRLVSSFVWTDEEAKYFKAVLKWKEKEAPTSLNSDDTSSSSKPDGNNGISQHSDRRTEQEEEQATEPSQQKPAAAGEFRILVIGARGTGKTSILTRFATNTFPGESQPPDPFYSRGCRHRIELDASSAAYSFTLPGQGQPQGLGSPLSPTTKTQNHQNQQQKRVYIVDALELPSQHLPSDPMLEQALNLTEAGVLVYDVADAKSLQLVLGIAEFVREYLDRQNGIDNPGAGSSGNGYYPRRREFPLILVGNKSDISAEPQADDAGPNNEAQTDEKETTAMTGSKREVPCAEGSKAAAAQISALGNINTNTITITNLNDGFGSGAEVVPSIKVSAKTGDNINLIFPMLAREILRSRWLFEQRERRQQQQQQHQQQQEQVMLLGGPRSRDLLAAAAAGQTQSQGLGPTRLGIMGHHGVVGMGYYRGSVGGTRTSGTDHGHHAGKEEEEEEESTGYSSSTAAAASGRKESRRKKTGGSAWRKVMGYCCCCFGD